MEQGLLPRLRLVLARIVGFAHIAFVAFILTRPTPTSALILSSINPAPLTSWPSTTLPAACRADQLLDECDWLVQLQLQEKR